MGRPIQINRVAKALLEEADRLALGAGGLAAFVHDESVRLTGLIRGAAGPATPPTTDGAAAMRITRPSGRDPYAVVITRFRLPARRGGSPGPVAVFIGDSERKTAVPQEGLGRLYGLSPAEARVAVALATGRSIQEVADELCISIHTARTHLKRILEKTGTSRQSQLVRLLLTGPACVALNGRW